MKITSLKKIENASLQYDIQTGSQNFFADGVLVHNSMVTPVLVDGIIKFKTKKSFETKEAALALDICLKTKDGVAFCLKMAELGLTPTFEVTSPKYPIVLKYDKDELTLLHVRENVSGKYLTEEELYDLGSPFPIVENIMEEFFGDGLPARLVSYEKLKAAAETREGIEGWIIQFKNGDMVKVKTKWYNELHKTIVFLRERDVARIAIEDKIDDLIGHFVLVGKDPAQIRRINKIVLEDLARIEDEVRSEHQKLKGSSKKDAALATKGHRLFGLIMRAMDGKEVDARGWYNKNVLDSKFSLEVIDSGKQILETD